jgi:hypothetical protein
MLRAVLVTIVFMVVAGNLARAEPRAQDVPKAAARAGLIFGTVVWAGPDPKFPYRDCDVHGWDIEGHPEVTGGLADVIVTAEPLDLKVRSAFQDAPLDKDDAEMTWREDIPERVMVARPKGSLTIDNLEDHHVTLGVFLNNVRLATLSLAPEEKGQLRDLKDGLLHIVNEETGSVGWVRVTPYPSHKTGGNCRFMFNPLPAGRYLLRGWHPRAGERTRQLNVFANQRVGRIRLLIFGAGGGG